MREGRTLSRLDPGGCLEGEEGADLLVEVGAHLPDDQAVEESNIGRGRPGARGGIRAKRGEQAGVGGGIGREAVGERRSLIEEG